MEKFNEHAGVSAPLDLQNVDTDMIIPKQYLKTIKRTGLKVGLFAELREDADGNQNADFFMNQPQYADATVLVTRDNFGCGSSREHAPWALRDYGIRVILAPSYADIFFNNCFNNSILPIALPTETIDELMKDANQASRIKVSLSEQTITRADGSVITFDVDPARKNKLLEGIDFVGETLQHTGDIDTYEGEQHGQRPWEASGTGMKAA